MTTTTTTTPVSVSPAQSKTPSKYTMQTFIEICIVITIAIIIMYHKHGYIYNDCYFDDPRLDHIKTNQTSSDYCVHNKDHQKIRQLCTFMRLYCMDQACTASEFGSYVNTMYIKKRDLCLINPVIDKRSDLNNNCYEKGIITVHSLETLVKYVNEEELKLNTIKFYGLENFLFEKTLGIL